MAILNPDQVEGLLSIIERHTSVFTGTVLGTEFLSNQEKLALARHGVNIKKLYEKSGDPVFMNYQLGMLSKVLSDKPVDKLSYRDLKRMIAQGHYISLTHGEKAVLKSVKNQALSDIRSTGGRIFNDINQSINETDRRSRGVSVRASQEKLIRDVISRGLTDRDQVKEIARTLHKKTGDWSRDFGRIVQFVSHRALSEGRAAIIKRKGGNLSKVYVHVYPGACKSCISLFLTAGEGSAPKIFTLEFLEGNGSNIGSKVSDWLPVLPPVHPRCRCDLFDYEGGEWDGSKFSIPKDVGPSTARPKIKVKVGDKEYLV